MIDWGEIINLPALVAFLLVMFRVGGIFIAAPFFSNRSIPAQIKIGLIVMVSLAIFPSISFQIDPLAFSSDLFLLKLILQEVSIGVIMGLAAAMVFATIQAAGEILGMKVGFAIATIIDPANQGASNIMASLYIVFGSLIFLYLDGHHVILGSIVQSFEVLELGQSYNIAGAGVLTDLVTKLVILAIKISAPVIIVTSMLTFMFGFIQKLSPQMNIYFSVGFILGPVVGILTLVATLPLFRYLIAGMTNEMRPELMRLVLELKGT